MLDPSRMQQPWFRDLARVYVMDAVGGEAGRNELDPRYIAQTEGRDVGAARASYSSCGDLVHGLWHHIGITAHWVNRAANGTYKTGQNISKICYTLPSLGRRALQPNSIILAGDAMVIWERADTTDAHTFVALEHDSETLMSGDYGQPGGALRRRKLVWETLGGVDVPFIVGKTKKRIRVWAPLDCVIDVAKSEGKWESPV